MNFNTRPLNFLGAFICYQLIVTALYFQYAEYMDPCPLCIFQRVAVISLGAVLLINAMFNPIVHGWFNRILQIIGLFWALAGVAIAGKHVYIQNLPMDEIPECGAPLDVLMDVMPFFSVITQVLTGDGKCAEINWEFWGLSMPGWMLVIFIIASVVMLVRLIQSFKKPKYY